ncbi:MAG: sulfite reductase subunit alpha [Methylacidiphilales bacterium]|nr:sulfite reductase subunit alpha [Candidatus Methylacidiphilales bacterium]MDW8348950.1 sulfite reductase subunit alpha [Verrucomicrobiae bacterium]
MNDSSEATPSSPYNRLNPFQAPLIENRRLNKPGSQKDTRHIVFSIEGSQLTYEVGASLGVYARNFKTVVHELLQALKWPADLSYNTKPESETRPIFDVLLSDFILNRVSKKFVKLVFDHLPQGKSKDSLRAIVEDPDLLDEYTHSRDYVDVLREYPAEGLTPEEVLPTFNKAVPRLYSIASSLKVHPNQVHLTVGVVCYHTHGRTKYGYCSGYLAHELPLGSTTGVYLQPSKHFHLAPPDRPIIMVGPGTGIAPFRAFLQEREATGATGKNWLFFGDQHAATDFLYGEEFESYRQKGLLTYLHTAFSRDQSEKIYVQHRMLENSRQLWDWLQNGAYFYVCGDAKRMAKDVHETLIQIAQKEGGLDREAAENYVNVTLSKTEKRYLKDVY